MKLLNRRISTITILMVAAMSVAAVGSAQVRKSNAETRLVGINLYDPGTKVISMYGSPLEIQAVGGGGSTGPVGAGGGGGGVSGGGGPRGPVGKGSAASAIDSHRDLTDFGNELLQMGPGGDELTPNRGGDGGERGGRGGGGMGLPGGGGGGGSTMSGIQFTRWVYKRGNSKYGFVLDKSNRVVQIEAIGLNDGRVSTRKGVRFGSTFGTLVKTYGAPDGYEISGNSMVVRFLINNKVAFRMNRLGKDQVHRVTGIVVSAGKA